MTLDSITYLQVGLWVSLLGVDETGELQTVNNNGPRENKNMINNWYKY